MSLRRDAERLLNRMTRAEKARVLQWGDGRAVGRDALAASGWQFDRGNGWYDGD